MARTSIVIAKASAASSASIAAIVASLAVLGKRRFAPGYSGHVVNESSRETPAVVFDNVSMAFDEQEVLRDVSFSVAKGRMSILLGASGSGKSVLLKLILGLMRPDSGSITVDGQRIDVMSEQDLLRVRADIGMSFQETALFDSLSVAENVGYRLSEELRMPPGEVDTRVEEVLGFVGLTDYGERATTELSGGQRRRVAIARAMAAKPHLLLLDDPTTGLDPITAASVDDEIVKLRDVQHVTSIVVTHQIRDAVYVATHQAIQENGTLTIKEVDAKAGELVEFLVLRDGRIHFAGSRDELLTASDSYLKEFLFMTLPPW
jgi:phospholipid/cholesterol/gamma-HCH transport system ATP-binding protein